MLDFPNRAESLDHNISRNCEVAFCWSDNLPKIGELSLFQIGLLQNLGIFLDLLSGPVVEVDRVTLVLGLGVDHAEHFEAENWGQFWQNLLPWPDWLLQIFIEKLVGHSVLLQSNQLLVKFRVVLAHIDPRIQIFADFVTGAELEQSEVQSIEILDLALLNCIGNIFTAFGEDFKLILLEQVLNSNQVFLKSVEEGTLEVLSLVHYLPQLLILVQFAIVLNVPGEFFFVNNQDELEIVVHLDRLIVVPVEQMAEFLALSKLKSAIQDVVEARIDLVVALQN